MPAMPASSCFREENMLGRKRLLQLSFLLFFQAMAYSALLTSDLQVVVPNGDPNFVGPCVTFTVNSQRPNPITPPQNMDHADPLRIGSSKASTSGTAWAESKKS